MTRRLILIRHAKSSWDDPACDDHSRPLNARGRQAAAALGRWLALRGYRPDAVLTSTATRTRETWARIAPALTDPPEPQVEGRLYLAPPEVLLAVLRAARGATVLMLGHNPGIAAFAAALCATPPRDPDFARYPTGATLVADFPLDDWAQLRPGTGSVRDFVTPRMLA